MIRASFGKTVARSMLIGGLALLAVPAIAGCEAGENAPTLEFHNAAAGGYDKSTPMHISDAFVLGAPSGSSVPAGGAASLFLGMANTGGSDDKLVSVNALDPQSGQPVAASVAIQGGSVAIPANGSVNLTGPKPVLVLKGLKDPLQSGETVAVVLGFQGVGQVKVNAPVEAQSDYYSTYSPPAAAAAAAPQASGKAGVKPAGAKAAAPNASGTASPVPSPAATGSPAPSATPTKK